MVYFILALLVCAAGGYLLGSINTSLIVGKFYQLDVRQHGSGNAGTTNVLRTLGKKAAIFTFLGDFAKGILASLLGRYLMLLIPVLFGEAVFGTVSIPEQAGLMAAGAFCVFGHNWPVYFGFKGGKGVLTTFAVFLMMAPIPALMALAVFILLAAISRYISLASIVAAVFLPLLVWITSLAGWNLVAEPVGRYLLFCIPLSLLVVFRHRKNIRKLLDGTENRLGSKERKDVPLEETEKEENQL